MDCYDRQTRSRVMSRNRSRGTKSTEVKLRALLSGSGISGWRLGHKSDVIGRPDFIFENQHVAIFVDGCFWHGCHRCRSIPSTNKEFWTTKIGKNQTRDRRVCRSLRENGWSVVRIWEHELRINPALALGKVTRALSLKTHSSKKNAVQRHK